MNRKSDDIFDELLRRATQRGQKQENQDDVVIYYVTDSDGRETPVMEKRSEIQFIPDPEDPNARMPVTVSHVRYRLDDLGKPFKSIKEVGECKFGCVVRTSSVFVCRICHRNACQRHIFFVGKNAYCHSFLCSLIGRTHQICRWIYLVIRFCYRSILGQSDEPNEDTQPEEGFFTHTEEEDLPDEEMR